MKPPRRSGRSRRCRAICRNGIFCGPQWLLALPLGLALIGLCWHYLAPRSNWDRLCDAHLLRYLTVGQNRPGGRRPLGALLVGYLLAVVAAAGPSWEQQPQPAYRTAQGRVLVYDLSSSMDSIDLAPSRLTRARFKLTDLIAAGQGRQQGLVVFAGDAFVVAPLTDDIETLHNLIPSLTTASVPVQGSRADLGLKLAAELLDNAGYTHGEVILIADGVSADSAAVAADLARRDYPVSVLAVGSGQGATDTAGRWRAAERCRRQYRAGRGALCRAATGGRQRSGGIQSNPG